MSKTTSILKQIDPNTQTRETNDSNRGWIQKDDLIKVKADFKGMQIKILHMFTLAKSELSNIYQGIVSRIKKIEKSLYIENTKISSSFWSLVQDIQADIQQKTNKMSQNIQNAVCNSFLFDQLMSMMPDFCTMDNTVSSQKKVNNSNSFSSAHKLTQMINQTVVDLENISFNEYKSALKINPNQKRVDCLGLLSGKWDSLEIISLQNKKISKMIPLSTIIADSLQQINLSDNQIVNLMFLNDAHYPILRLLNLRKNCVHSLEGLQLIKLPNLKHLNLSQNKIKKIDCLKQVIFPQLIQLNLSHNKLQKADILTECDFPKLEVLNIDHNLLDNIDFIPNCSFYRLKIFSFCYNQIKKIDSLKKCRLQKLQALLGYNNKIQSIDFLQKCDLPMLKQIILNNNMIQDISIIEKMKFKYLAQFDLENNNIQMKQVLCFVTKNDQCKKAKKKYPFISF